MNRIHLIGNLSKEPELSTTPNGVSVCKFTIAVNRKYGAEGCDFINIVAWRERGENCQKYLGKGKKCYVGGTLQIRSYKDNEGAARTITEVIADEVEFLSPKDGNGEQSKQESANDLKYIGSASLPF